MKNFLKRLVPLSILSAYHKTLAVFAAFVYRHPSEKMVVIGVTGTNGKSTTVNLIGQLLEAAGHTIGFTTTVNFKVGKKEWLNATKMTMLGRFQLQKLLREMVDARCEYAVIETSSQGVAQFRHYGINYDVAVFTNLTPEHIESHGGFEDYKAAKGELFEHLTNMPRKTIGGTTVPKRIVVNGDDENAEYFLGFGADEKHLFSLKESPLLISPLNEGGEKGESFSPLAKGGERGGISCLKAADISVGQNGSTFSFNGASISLPLLGVFNVQNAMAALTTVVALDVPLEIAAGALSHIRPVPGRMEFIDAGQPFKALIDYAPEPAGLTALIEFLKTVVVREQSGKIIHVLGSTGGGRDVSRRPVLGRLAGEYADIVIVTNEDPYDDDPQKIIDAVAAGAIDAGKRDGETMFKILDRREAIRKALTLAKPDDVVVITGKGAEQAMCVAHGKKISWDDRVVVREELSRLENKTPSG